MSTTKLKACHIDAMAPGTKIKIDTLWYIRMQDDIAMHIEGCILKMTDGSWGHWSRIVNFDDFIEVE